MTLYVASNNAHKLDEIRAAMPGFDLRRPADAGIDFDFPEDAETFIGNSTGKALALWRLLGVPVLADDSGLCVDALDGRPGVLSARYGARPGESPLDSATRNELLLAEMRGRADRACRFVCCMSLVMSTDRLFVVQETCEGTLLESPRGEGGFGYDPIVYLPTTSCSVAELDAAAKNRVSHRGRAIARIVSILEDMKRMP
ncbi:MAG: non-canonical purine NTP pyrophosphatase [Spirochaetales bacterium]|nr:non-canonical purine NTP pyrophosphatase [Spirochaetales bacterium]